MQELHSKVFVDNGTSRWQLSPKWIGVGEELFILFLPKEKKIILRMLK